MKRVAIVGAGVSGLTCAVVFAERGYRVSIFAEEIGQNTTSAAAGAIWYPYDAEPVDAVIAWALETYKVLVDLSRDRRSGVKMIQLRTFLRAGEIQIPEWAPALGARSLKNGELLPAFKSGFVLSVPLMDTTIYLDYLAKRLVDAGGEINGNVRFGKLEDVDPTFDLIVNCSGIGARELVNDVDLESHRGQVAIVPKVDISSAIVCDYDPLMYAIPRANDCLFGGTNDLSDNRAVDPTTTARIVAECSRVLNVEPPKVVEERVGLRPFRKSGVCLRADRLRDGRAVIHDYGHGGSGFTLSWGCAEQVWRLRSTLHDIAADRR
ncbi:MAG: FAD-binding oxidoreductase [Verrucomicrobiota bacterium]|nr:FAD-binding oxidoreductase [Verrucomicrobiota bacterium]